MAHVQLPELPEHTLSFVVDGRVRAPSGPEAAEEEEPEDEAPELAGRVVLGGPVAFPMTAERYPDVAAYIEQEAAHHRYHEVHLSVTFVEKQDGPPLHSVTLRVNLAAKAPADQPIAWSMAPARIDDPSQRDVQFEIKPQLKVAGIEASIGMLGGNLPGSRTPFLRATRELRSDPRWELKRTKNLPLAGTQRVVLVVRADAGAVATMAVEVTAATRSSILRRYRALPTPLRLAADL
ncbi:hypothetical protein [Acrocarpospora sp. B8E8]|uniref:hypothetical protein n=1 Tax=Acrocarpospora sp. B8E8 TaxID=3153572 RepID=UPI00325C9A07